MRGPNTRQSILKSNTPKEGIRNSARIFCCVFILIFALCFIVFLSLTLIDFINYINALNSSACAGMDSANGLGQFFDASALQGLARAEAIATYGEDTVNETPTLIENVKTTILSKYTLHDGVYCYNMLPIIDYKCWISIAICLILIIAIAIQIYTAIRLEKAEYTEYYMLIALQFIVWNIPSAILMICGRKDQIYMFAKP